MTKKNTQNVYPLRLRKEYFEYCKEFMSPIDLINIQSTAILHFKYIQLFYIHTEKPLKFLTKLSHLFINCHVDGLPLFLKDYEPPNIPLHVLNDPIELLRMVDNLPNQFWKLNRFVIPSRPRLNPPQTRQVFKECGDSDRKNVLVKAVKHDLYEKHHELDDDTFKIIFSKQVQKRLGALKKFKVFTVSNSTVPLVSSPLRNSFDQEDGLVDRRDSKMDGVDNELIVKDNLIEKAKLHSEIKLDSDSDSNKLIGPLKSKSLKSSSKVRQDSSRSNRSKENGLPKQRIGLWKTVSNMFSSFLSI